MSDTAEEGAAGDDAAEVDGVTGDVMAPPGVKGVSPDGPAGVDGVLGDVTDWTGVEGAPTGVEGDESEI